MGRPRLDPEEESFTASVRLTKAEMEAIDELRGPQTRSAFLRYCLQRAMIAEQTARKALDALLAGEW